MGEALGIEFYLFSWSDLFGIDRSKLVPASAVRDIATGGAGFAGFAAYMDMSPADGDVLCLPDPSSFTQLPWKPEVAVSAAQLHNSLLYHNSFFSSQALVCVHAVGDVTA